MAFTDRRELEFDAEALLLAVSVSSRAAQAFGLPAQLPTGVRLYPHEGQVDFLYGAGQAVRMAAEPLGAVLVSYCIRARIPMATQRRQGYTYRGRRRHPLIPDGVCQSTDTCGAR
jgi:hypothetical protein